MKEWDFEIDSEEVDHCTTEDAILIDKMGDAWVIWKGSPVNK